jgi:glucose/arabinose dehydrogenase
MTGRPRRRLIVPAAVSLAALSLFLGLNAGGWRARLLARLLRANNWPVAVSPPPNFQPQVPPGFKVSVFTRGFDQPRWLAVAPNGDVFVADSAAGKEPPFERELYTLYH